MKRTCLVTGASGDIGQAVAKTLADRGNNLILHFHRNERAIHSLVEELPDRCIREVISADLSSDEGILYLISKLEDNIGTAVFAHGSSLIEIFQHTTEVSMDKMLTSHVKAPWMISKHILPAMIERKAGNIVLVSSIWGEAGASCEVVYSSVKGAQNSFVKALGKELAPSGIAVNGVLPGLVNTKMNAHFTKQEMKEICEEIPANRAAEPEEVAQVVTFLTNPGTTYVNGELIKVTGGW